MRIEIRSEFLNLAIASGSLLLLSGCASIDQAKLESGPRFDEDGKFTDTTEATVPIFKSGGD